MTTIATTTASSHIFTPITPPFNPDSRWQETTVGLTLYDREREPRTLNNLGTVRISLDKVQEQVQCSICLGVIKQASMVAECTHRFCKPCIEASLRNSKNCCPLCRIHIPSRRSVRLDPVFDSIIACLYPDLKAFEDKEIEKMEKAQRLTQESSTRARQGLDRQSSLSAAREQSKPRPVIAATNTAASGTRQGNGRSNKQAKPSRDEDLFFVLRRHPRDIRGPEKNLTREYIRASSRIKVQHLKQFLKAQYESVSSKFPESSFNIVYVSPRGNEHIQPNPRTLQEIVDEFKGGDYDADLILHYTIALPAPTVITTTTTTTSST